jgi:membrane-associated phospholipid phosphatase
MSSSQDRTEPSGGRDDSIAAPAGARAGRQVTLLTIALCAGFIALSRLVPHDGTISRWAVALRENHLGGDVVRELGALQQYGQGAVTALVAWSIWLLQPRLRRRLLDWLLAVGVAAVAGYPAKMLIGRPRPKFGDPEHFLGPFGVYPVSEEVGLRHAWEIGSGISSDLWSMPSSHTLYAVVMSSMLWVWYPRLRPVAVTMAVVVGASRVLFGAHYLTDVLVGGALGAVIAVPIARTHAGVRLVDAAWRRVVDRDATPALPGLLEAEREG